MFRSPLVRVLQERVSPDARLLVTLRFAGVWPRRTACFSVRIESQETQSQSSGGRWFFSAASND